MSHMINDHSAQLALLGSSLSYSSIYFASLPKSPSPVRIAQSREAISIFHCALQTALSIICLRGHAEYIISGRSDGPTQTVDSQLPVITTRSSFANCITAIEAGYLLADSVILLHARRVRSRLTRQLGKPNAGQVKGWNFLHLGLHHAVTGTLLLILQWYIARGREKGILIIVALHLMNASSVFGTTRWFLVNFRPSGQQLILGVTAMYLTVFAICRVYLIYWILGVFAEAQGISTWAAFAGLRLPCKMGTTGFMLVNSAWLLTGIKNFGRRVHGRKTPRK